MIAAPVGQLVEIFKTLPMALTPSVFYRRVPVGFKVSQQPGFLTSEGALLFPKTADDERFLKVLDMNALIKDSVWEGQLIVPVWARHEGHLLGIWSVLLIWLYLDLPQYITPTPGISPTILVMRLVDLISNSPQVIAEVAAPVEEKGWNGMVSQWIFFSLHVFKILIVWMIIYLGAVNTLSLNPLSLFSTKKLGQQDLINIGWTGARRITPLDWREENRNAQIKAAGGVGAALASGLLERLPTAGVYLGYGEGWNTPIGNEASTNEEGMFLLCPKYYKQLYEDISVELHDDDVSDEKKNDLLKSFRRTGPVLGPQSLRDVYEERKKRGHGNLKKKNLTTETKKPLEDKKEDH